MISDTKDMRVQNIKNALRKEKSDSDNPTVNKNVKNCQILTTNIIEFSGTRTENLSCFMNYWLFNFKQDMMKLRYTVPVLNTLL